MDFVTIIGFAAATCIAFSFISQVWHIIKTRDTKGISLTMYSFFSTGILCWLLYGIFLGSLPVILANAGTLVLALTILIFKIKLG